MHSNINSIKNELKELCNEYVNILEKLKNEGIISDEVFKNCISGKVTFLEE
ncbi:MAG: hypothetical protein ACRC92_15735 [Peptostreptococcaceae bacterium]